jgi:hypothetical protein
VRVASISASVNTPKTWLYSLKELTAKKNLDWKNLLKTGMQAVVKFLVAP